MTLKFYDKEWREFCGHFNTRITQAQACVYFEQLKKHYRTPNVTLQFSNRRRGSGNFRYMKNWLGYGTITLGKEPNVGILCHEFSHAIDHCDRHKGKHDQWLFNIMRGVMEYADAQGWVEHPEGVDLSDDDAVVEALIAGKSRGDRRRRKVKW